MTMTKKFLSCSLALVCAVPTVTSTAVSEQYVDYRNPDVYNSKRNFFERSGFGALAVMPNVTSQSIAANEYEYITLSISGLYRIARQRLRSPDWWFILNHRSGSRVSDRHTYAGVFIAKRLKQPQAIPLELFRSTGWYELGPDSLDEFTKTYESLEEFFELQHDGAMQNSFEQVFGGWHAKPDIETNESSWHQRKNWLIKSSIDRCFQAIGEGKFDESKVFFQARLIRFRVTTGLNSRSPVVWNIGLRQADAFFIKTFSPQSVDFNGEYCVDIE